MSVVRWEDLSAASGYFSYGLFLHQTGAWDSEGSELFLSCFAQSSMLCLTSFL